MIIKKTASLDNIKRIVTTKWYFLGIKFAEFQRWVG